MKELKTDGVINFQTGEFISDKLSTYYKKLSETATIYENKEAASNSDEVAYYVTSEIHDQPEDNKFALNWGLTCIYPITVDGECAMTRGHFHSDKEYPEYYMCTSGEGHLLCWDGEDEVMAYHMTAGSLQYIDGKIAHRLINTGDEIFKVAACWNVNAGHDYQTIEDQGFPIRAYKDNGKLVWKNSK